MNFQSLTALLPCYSLEDLATERPGDEAAQILSAWSALWHPALIAASGQMPHWASANSPPQTPAGHLCVVPPCCENLLPSDWLRDAAAAGAGVIRQLGDRPQIVAAALALLEPGTAAPEPPLTADFLALGFCHFTVELLTRKLRYTSNLDAAAFESQVVTAAKQACQGDDIAATRQHLQAAFDLLHTAREYHYPLQPRLLDLTLVASTTLGASLRAELSSPAAVNLLLSGQVIEEMAQREPASLEAVREALEKGRLGLIGGEYSERELTLLSPEALAHQLQEGIAAYQRRLGARPLVFGRRRFGLTPVLPQILEKFGFTGVLHATLDDGRFPSGNQSRVRWEGLDGTVLEALQRIPDDVSGAGAFLGLAQRLGNALDVDHTPTLICAHWPAAASPWYQDLRRIAAYSSVLGTFTTITEYFQQTGTAVENVQHTADQYRSPYLKQAVAAGQSDPVSRWGRYFQRRAAAEAAQSLTALATLAAAPTTDQADTTEPSRVGQAERRPTIEQQIEDSGAATPAADAILDARLQDRLDGAIGQFVRVVAGPERADAPGALLANPCSFARRACVDLTGLARLPDVVEPIQAAGESAGRKTVVVDLPPLGFAWITPGAAAPQPKAAKWSWFRKQATPPATLVEQRPVERPARKHSAGSAATQETVLHNEFFTVAIDPHTGAIRAISDYRSRGPRLAQQLALRLPSQGSDEAAYSIMAADEVRVVSAGPALGEVVACGRLLSHGGRRLAGFRQTTRICRGSRIIELLIELDVDAEPEADPWNSYYAARFAWPDDAAKLIRSASMAGVATEMTQLEAPHFIDIGTASTRTTLLPAGLPYHRRHGLRRLDTLLVVKGERCRRFRLGIGIDVPNPLAAAVDFLTPPTLLSTTATPARGSGWLFHLDVRNVVATHWEPLAGGPLPTDARRGFRVRLLESEGRRVTLNLRCLRPLHSARKLGSGTSGPVDLPTQGDRVAIDLRPYEWAEVEAWF